MKEPSRRRWIPYRVGDVVTPRDDMTQSAPTFAVVANSSHRSAVFGRDELSALDAR